MTVNFKTVTFLYNLAQFFFLFGPVVTEKWILYFCNAHITLISIHASSAINVYKRGRLTHHSTKDNPREITTWSLYYVFTGQSGLMSVYINDSNFDLYSA